MILKLLVKPPPHKPPMASLSTVFLREPRRPKKQRMPNDKKTILGESNLKKIQLTCQSCVAQVYFIIM
jgi:hypothetical protein